MKYLVGILLVGLSCTIYLLIVQHNELYTYKNGTGIDNCLLEDTTAKKYIKYYQEKFSVDSNKTKAVWFSEDIIRCLYINIIRKDKKDTIDGFRVYLANYNGDLDRSVIKADNPIANTVLFVPTSSRDSGTHHIDLWNLIKKDNEAPRLKPKFFDVPNHGELCPQKCD